MFKVERGADCSCGATLRSRIYLRVDGQAYARIVDGDEHEGHYVTLDY